MTSQLKIRSAKSLDASEISSLAIRSKANWGYSQEFIEACRSELTVTKEDINSDDLNYVVAEVASNLVGFYAIKKDTLNEYELEALFVEPDYIGTGIGRALMNHAIAAVRKLDVKKLIIQGDPNAEKFYRAAGGKLIGMRESASISGRILPVFAITIPQN